MSHLRINLTLNFSNCSQPAVAYAYVVSTQYLLDLTKFSIKIETQKGKLSQVLSVCLEVNFLF